MDQLAPPDLEDREGSLDPQEHPETVERQDNQVESETKAQEDPRDNQDLLDKLEDRDNQENVDQEDPLDHEAQTVHQENVEAQGSLGLQDQQDRKEKEVHRVNLALLVNKDHKANQDFKDYEVIRVREDHQDPRELADSQGIGDCRDHVGNEDSPDSPAHRVNAVFPVNQETLDELDRTDPEVNPEKRENRDHKEGQVRVLLILDVWTVRPSDKLSVLCFSVYKFQTPAAAFINLKLQK